MSFRKRNVALSNTGSKSPVTQNEKISTPGIRISPVTSHPTISTGTVSLDKLLGLGAGQPLGTSLLIEEEGTTDFASALLKCYVAQAIIQGHKIFVVGPDGWASQLPGVVENRGSEKEQGSIQDAEKMKIAWRYERLGAHGEDRRIPGGLPCERILQFPVDQLDVTSTNAQM
jgi:elongator complex protein 4